MVFIWPVDHHPRRHSSPTGGMVVAPHRLVHGLPDTNSWGRCGKPTHFSWFWSRMDMHTHSLSISQWIAVILNHEHQSAVCCCSRSGQLHLAVPAKEDSGGQDKKSIPLFRTCKTTSGALWGGLEGHLCDLKPSSFKVLRTWLNKALRKLFYQDLLWACV